MSALSRQTEWNTHSTSQLSLGKSITSAVPSPDGMYIAAVVSPTQLSITRCPSERAPMLYHVCEISSRKVQKVLAQAEILRWSPEVFSTSHSSVGDTATDPQSHLLRAWLLVSDGQRLIVFVVDLNTDGAPKVECKVLADYDLGSHLGKFSFADFVFSHEYAIVLQKVGIQASIISLTRPERHDIMNIKYAGLRGLDRSPDGECFSILTRSEGQDLVMVFTTREMGSIKCNTFSPLTYDAQGIKWSPEHDPILCVWDSAVFGFKVSFFTANGHYLRHLDLNSEILGLVSLTTNVEGLGVNTVHWLSYDGKSVLAVFNSDGQLFVQRPCEFERLRSRITTINHPHIVDGATCLVWQESQDRNHIFLLQSSSFELRSVQKMAGADQVAINAECELVATKDSSRPWTVWIWTIPSPQLLAVINFRDRVKQVLWHPRDPEILLLTTTQAEPLLYIWYATKQQIYIAKGLHVDENPKSCDYEAKWVGSRVQELPVLFMSSPHHYDAGIMPADRDGVAFQSFLHQVDLDMTYRKGFQEPWTSPSKEGKSEGLEA